MESETTLFLEENGYCLNVANFNKKGYNHSIRFGESRHKFEFVFWIGESWITITLNIKQVKTIKNLKSILSFLIESIILIENNMLKISSDLHNFIFDDIETTVTDYNMFFYPIFFTISLYGEEDIKFIQDYSIVNRLGFRDQHSGELVLILDNQDILVRNIYE
jgi:hypothetical protein